MSKHTKKSQTRNQFSYKIGGKEKPIRVIEDTIKFQVGDPAAIRYLDEHGYVVYSEVANAEQTTEAINLFWTFMSEAFPHVNKEDMSTWDPWPQWSQTGIVSAYGIGQSKFQWYTRSLPKVKQMFSELWQDDDLVVSFDAAGAFRPPDYNDKWQTNPGWFHFDQNGYAKKGRHCVQGLLNLLPCGKEDGGFTLIPKTHSLFDKLFAARTDLCDAEGSDFVRITKSGFMPEIFEDPEYCAIKLCLNPGDFVMWDSRTAHSNHPASVLGGGKPAAELRRLVSYVCMTPASMVRNKKDYIRDRAQGFKDGMTTSHWPHEYQPRGAIVTNVSKPEQLTNEQKELIVGKNGVKMFDELMKTN